VKAQPAPSAAPPAPITPAPAPAAPTQQAANTPLSAAQERALKPKDTFQECSGCPIMMVVPAGSFTMGSPASEPDRRADEGPQHTVTIAGQFAVGRFTVTVDQFSAFVKETGYNAGSKCWTFADGKWEERADRSWRDPGFPQTGSQPSVCLNWNDASAYVAWLAKKTGKPYRLLSESEYEYATRSGRTTAYPWGNAIGKNNANCDGCGSQWDGKQTAPVGSFAANGFGLYDMVGNVWEWTQDCYHESYSGAPADGSAWINGTCGTSVQRGGSWFNDPRSLRSAGRGGFITLLRLSMFGFRVGRTLLTP
jgi:formylglycine-generating enzyme required for sulfatase activity